MRFVRNQHRLKAALEQMARPAMPAMEPHGVGGVEPLQGAAEVAERRAQEQVVVVVHQAKGEHVKIKARDRRGQRPQKSLLILIVQEDDLTVIAPAGQVIEGLRKLDAPRSCHDRQASKSFIPCQASSYK